MPRQSFIVLELVFRKLEKTITAAFLCRVRVSEYLWESWDVDMSVEQHGYDCSYALACESRAVPQREQTLKYCPSLQPFVSALPPEYRQEVDPATQ